MIPIGLLDKIRVSAVDATGNFEIIAILTDKNGDDSFSYTKVSDTNTGITLSSSEGSISERYVNNVIINGNVGDEFIVKYIAYVSQDIDDERTYKEITLAKVTIPEEQTLSFPLPYNSVYEQQLTQSALLEYGMAWYGSNEWIHYLPIGNGEWRNFLIDTHDNSDIFLGIDYAGNISLVNGVYQCIGITSSSPTDTFQIGIAKNEQVILSTQSNSGIPQSDNVTPSISTIGYVSISNGDTVSLQGITSNGSNDDRFGYGGLYNYPHDYVWAKLSFLKIG